MENFDWSTVYPLLAEYVPKVLLALLILILGYKLIAGLTRRYEKVAKRRGIDESLRPFLASVINVGLKVMLLISVAAMIGVQTTSFVAVLGALAFAIGMALQGSLGNFASGVMVLLFKPYKLGDYVEVNGQEGIVEEIQIFNTILKTFDNQRIIIPNSLITSNPINNKTAYDLRRVDMVFGISYEDDIDKSRLIIEQTLKRSKEILNDPAPDIFVSELADSSVNFVVRPWCMTEDYWTVYFYCHEELKKAFDAEGIGIPFPQMDIHLHNR